MITKRKCVSEGDPVVEPKRRRLASPQPLTRSNLSMLDQSMAVALPGTPPSTSKRSKTSASMTSSSRASTVAGNVLELWAMYQDRQMDRPAKLGELIARISQKRSGRDVTPNSKETVRLWKEIPTLSETEAIHAACDTLFFKDFMHTDGERNIRASRDALWKAGCVPRPEGSADDAILAKALESVGAVSTPKPDVAFGYSRHAFDSEQLIALAAIPTLTNPVANVKLSPTHFPYLLVEWKSASGELVAAQCQARRDCAAAVSLMHEYYKACGISDSCPSMTAVFSASLDTAVIELRVHWRRTDSQGNITYEADWLDSGVFQKERDVFDIRSSIRNMLDWAQAARLQHIKGALSGWNASTGTNHAARQSLKRVYKEDPVS